MSVSLRARIVRTRFMKRILLLAICAGIALVNARAQTGDVAAGERLFAGKGNCTNCHMVRGRGGILGPDLSDIGRELTSAQIEQVLRAPGSASSYPAVTVHLRTGQTIHGIAKNESAFELQVLDMDGKLHLLAKQQVAEYPLSVLVHDSTVAPEYCAQGFASSHRGAGVQVVPPPPEVLPEQARATVTATQTGACAAKQQPPV